MGEAAESTGAESIPADNSYNSKIKVFRPDRRIFIYVWFSVSYRLSMLPLAAKPFDFHLHNKK